MQIAAFIGSPRKKGNTDSLIQEILGSAAGKGADTKVIYLNDLQIRGCQACMQCKQTSVRCAVNDDMQELYPLIESSDAVVLGSPIYIGNVTGLMKTFIDRWYVYAGVPDEKKLPPGKRVLLVLPYGREEESIFNHVAVQLGQAMKYVFGAKVESWLVPGLRDADALSRQHDLVRRAAEVGVSLAEQRSTRR
jgi:multimeric flavodoxin WrbA